MLLMLLTVKCFRASVDRFSVKEFEKGFLRAVDPFIHRRTSCTETR